MVKKFIRLLKRDNDRLILERTSNGYFYYKKIYHIDEYINALNDLKLWLDNNYIFLGVDYEDNAKLYDSDYIITCTNEYNSIYKNKCNLDSKKYINHLIENWRLFYGRIE